MRLKSFHAPTMSDAMAQLRKALGPDAIIVATRNEMDGVRITAAIEEAEDLPTPPPAAETDSLDAIIGALLNHGTPAQLAEKISLAAAPHRTKPAREALALALSACFRFEPLSAAERPILLAGPPGAGKTTAAAKLAAAAALSGQRPALIGADNCRAGANDALAAYAGIIGAGFAAIADFRQLPSALSGFADRRPVIIDSAGRNPFDSADLAELKPLVSPAVEPALVLAAGGDADESAEIASAFLRAGCRRLICTRLDATRRYGSLLAAASSGLAFSAASASSRIADGVAEITPSVLARLLLPQETSA